MPAGDRVLELPAVPLRKRTRLPLGAGIDALLDLAQEGFDARLAAEPSRKIGGHFLRPRAMRISWRSSHQFTSLSLRTLTLSLASVAAPQRPLSLLNSRLHKATCRCADYEAPRPCAHAQMAE